ncbi:uncharacterized protein LOC107630804 isoform X2 [Arachis ipaensis]|uniref:uncharacterized protein LOC107630804 isoform X2 n=1 Tax=Arachis ipaensis TaxID=130454 RepID=UPI000A2B6AD8|nr:uncharacterized protein LOC107630804 isoform X2 [Arachis ipaensis]
MVVAVMNTMLLLTTGSVLVEASPHDFFRGGGRDGEGLNYLGRLLMKLRSEFLGESSSSCEQLKFLTVVREESQGLNDLSLAGLSIHDDIEGLMFHSSKGSRYIFNEQEELSQQHINGNNFLDDIFAENAIVDDTNLNPLEFLASLFPGFAAESLVIVTLVSIRTLVQVCSFRTGCY